MPICELNAEVWYFDPYSELIWDKLQLKLAVPWQFYWKLILCDRFKAAWLTDKRVRIMNDVILGIQVIKMYAWENAFKKLITKLRRLVYSF